jgi:ABC-type iron transport system FetAB permease component
LEYSTGPTATPSPSRPVPKEIRMTSSRVRFEPSKVIVLAMMILTAVMIAVMLERANPRSWELFEMRQLWN